MRHLFRGSLLVATTLVLAGCGGSDAPITEPPVDPGPDPSGTELPAGARVVLDTRLVEVNQGHTARFSARLVDASGNTISDIPLSYATASGAPLAVDEAGVITGLKPGAGRVMINARGRKVDSLEVDVFGRPEGLIAGSFALDSRPFGAAVSRKGVVYVTRLDAGNMGITSTRERTLAGTVTVGAVPTGVTFDRDGAIAYVTNQYSGNVGVVDVASGAQVGTIDVAGDPFVVRVGPRGDRLYVTSNANLVSVVNLATRQVTDQIPVGFAPNGFAVTPDESRIYVASAFGSAVTELDAATDRVTRTFTVNGMPQDMIVSKDGSELYVANEAGWVDVIDLATGAGVARITLAGGGFGMALSPDQVHLYVSVPGAGVVQVVNTESRRLTHTIAVGGAPRRIAFDYHGGLAVVANEAGAVNFVR